jgi:hypothetical protein
MTMRLGVPAAIATARSGPDLAHVVRRTPATVLLLGALCAFAPALQAQARVDPAPRYAGVASVLTQFITEQMAE